MDESVPLGCCLNCSGAHQYDMVQRIALQSISCGAGALRMAAGARESSVHEM